VATAFFPTHPGASKSFYRYRSSRWSLRADVLLVADLASLLEFHEVESLLRIIESRSEARDPLAHL